MRAVMVGLLAAAMFGAPTPEDSTAPEGRWWSANSGRPFPARVSYGDPTGVVSILASGGAIDTRGHPFFTAPGPNGRACVTCHQPADGMSLAVSTIRARWAATRGADPLFAAGDGSNCPNLPQADAASHSLLLDRGLFRIARAWPPRAPDGTAVGAEFTIKVAHDPTGCNLDPQYGLYSAHPMVSVFRRPRPAANLKYVTTYGYTFEPKDGLPLPVDPRTGLRYSGNLLADQRARTLDEQARDALVSHLEMTGAPSPQQLDGIIRFESQIYAAQSADLAGGLLTDGGAQGGPDALASGKAGVLKSAKNPQWAEFANWGAAAVTPAAGAGDEVRAYRASVARGAALFRDRTFLISDSAGLNSMNFGNPTRDSCNFCHNATRTGMDIAPGQVDLGTTNEPFADPAPDLPLFKLTCLPGFAPQPFLGRVVFTHDPGFALTTGKCADIGKITIQSMRGLAARAPYFSNGSARTLREVVDFYDRRYNIGYTEQEKVDLTNLMGAL